MKAPETKETLRWMDGEANRLRRKLGFSEPNKLLYRSLTSLSESRSVVVEADGLGGAWTSVVEGGFPLDYLIFYEKHFQTEAEAVQVADDVVQLRADADLVLQPEAALHTRLQCERVSRAGA